MEPVPITKSATFPYQAVPFSPYMFPFSVLKEVTVCEILVQATAWRAFPRSWSNRPTSRLVDLVDLVDVGGGPCAWS